MGHPVTNCIPRSSLAWYYPRLTDILSQQSERRLIVQKRPCLWSLSFPSTRVNSKQPPDCCGLSVPAASLGSSLQHLSNEHILRVTTSPQFFSPGKKRGKRRNNPVLPSYLDGEGSPSTVLPASCDATIHIIQHLHSMTFWCGENGGNVLLKLVHTLVMR